MKKRDITGQRFGKLIAISESHRVANRIYWHCQCDCGTRKAIAKAELTRKNKPALSCGCNKKSNGTKHGQHGTPAYEKWRQMKARVSKTYERGNRCYQHVTICDRWNEFANFFSDMGNPPVGTTLERIDNSLGYSPSNCRWATPIEQANNKSNNVLITLEGKTLSIAQWARLLGVRYGTLYARLKRLPADVALTM